jgi:hypothetical protein
LQPGLTLAQPTTVFQVIPGVPSSPLVHSIAVDTFFTPRVVACGTDHFHAFVMFRRITAMMIVLVAALCLPRFDLVLLQVHVTSSKFNRFNTTFALGNGSYFRALFNAPFAARSL